MPDLHGIEFLGRQTRMIRNLRFYLDLRTLGITQAQIQQILSSCGLTHDLLESELITNYFQIRCLLGTVIGIIESLHVMHDDIAGQNDPSCFGNEPSHFFLENLIAIMNRRPRSVPVAD